MRSYFQTQQVLKKQKYDTTLSCSIKWNEGWGMGCLGTGPALQIGGNGSIRALPCNIL